MGMISSSGMTCSCSKLCAHMPRMKPNRQKLTAISTMKPAMAIGCATSMSTNRCAVTKMMVPTISDLVAAAPT